jgi:hypothetical protein
MSKDRPKKCCVCRACRFSRQAKKGGDAIEDEFRSSARDKLLRRVRPAIKQPDGPLLSGTVFVTPPGQAPGTSATVVLASAEHNVPPSEVLSCAFCGEEYPPGTPSSQDELLTAHIFRCPVHPLRRRLATMIRIIARWEKAPNAALKRAERTAMVNKAKRYAEECSLTPFERQS